MSRATKDGVSVVNGENNDGHRSERERVHLTLLAEAVQALDDVENGRVESIADFRAKYGR